MRPVYLDYNATTPVADEVLETMLPYLKGQFGNPSSAHVYGNDAKRAVEAARQEVADFLGCEPGEIVFTSGGTESNNLAIRGAVLNRRRQIHSGGSQRGGHIITSAVEHPAVLEVCRYLQRRAFDLTILPVDSSGSVDPDDLRGALRPDTVLVSIMHANNEVGTIQPIRELARIAREAGVLFHTDAAQSAGKIPIDVRELDVDLLSVAGHKMCAPKGVGALYIRKGVHLEKLLYGADHEQNLRAGTENVAQIVALGAAGRIARDGVDGFEAHYRTIRNHLENVLTSAFPGARVNGHSHNRLPNTLSISFPGIQAPTLISRLSGVAASAGSACHAESVEVSSVLEAMKVPMEYAMGTIRLSTGRETTREEAERAAAEIISVARELFSAGGIDRPDRTDINEKGGRPGNSTNRTVGNHLNDETTENVKLTRYTQGLGCACKLEPRKLENVLRAVGVYGGLEFADVLVGPEFSDDAAVYRLDNTRALVQTVDFFPPILDNPRDYGAVAAANALSDIYAMGGTPLFAMNILAFPSSGLPEWVMEEILHGAGETASAAGIPVVGGHTIVDSEPKFGMVVSGLVDPKQIWRNGGARPGDVLILTKAVGTGIITTGIKQGVVSVDGIFDVTRRMRELNSPAAEVLKSFTVHACTDVTGFGLLGHLREMAVASECSMEIVTDTVPFIPDVRRLAAAGVIPGGTRRNLRYVEGVTDFGNSSEVDRLILADAQTSGGLLAAVPAEQADEAIRELRIQGVTDAAIIGTVGAQAPAPNQFVLRIEYS
jgi:cysteine desulfurase NifS/selenium donor protein